MQALVLALAIITGGVPVANGDENIPISGIQIIPGASKPVFSGCYQNVSVEDAVKMTKREAGYTIYMKRCPEDKAPCVCLDGKKPDESVVAQVDGVPMFVSDAATKIASDAKKMQIAEQERLESLALRQIIEQKAAQIKAEEDAAKGN